MYVYMYITPSLTLKRNNNNDNGGKQEGKFKIKFGLLKQFLDILLIFFIV